MHKNIKILKSLHHFSGKTANQVCKQEHWSHSSAMLQAVYDNSDVKWAIKMRVLVGLGCLILPSHAKLQPITWALKNC